MEGSLSRSIIQHLEFCRYHIYIIFHNYVLFAQFAANYFFSYLSFLQSPVLMSSPFKVIYSGTLPAQPQSNRIVHEIMEQRGPLASDTVQLEDITQAKAKVWCCQITIRARGMSKSTCAAEPQWMTIVGQQSSPLSYGGVTPSMQHQISTETLQIMCRGQGSQWRTFHTYP